MADPLAAWLRASIKDMYSILSGDLEYCTSTTTPAATGPQTESIA
jgi:hypothetical protein